MVGQLSEGTAVAGQTLVDRPSNISIKHVPGIGGSSSFTEEPCTPKREHSFYTNSPRLLDRSLHSSCSLDCSSDGASSAAARAAAAAVDDQHIQVPAVITAACASPNGSSSSSSSSSSIIWSPDACSGHSCGGIADQQSIPLLLVNCSAGPEERFAGTPTLPSSSQKRRQCRRQQSSWGSTVVQLVLLAASCLGWVAVSSAMILINKHCMVELGFHFPAAVAALGMTGTTVFSFLACVVFRLAPWKASVSPYFFFTRVLSTAFFTALSFQAGNTAYLYLSVAFVQMLKAFTPVSTMLCGFLYKLERPSGRLIAAVCCICCGVVVSSCGELNFSLFGVLAMLLSIAAEGLRIVMMQHLLAAKQFNPIEVWVYLGPACCIWLALLIGVSEIHHIRDTHGWHIVLTHPSYFAYAALAGFAVNVLAMSVIKLASALTLKVLGICKDIGLVTFGVLLLGEHISGLQVCGYSVSLLGFGCYNYIKMSADAEGAAAAPLSDSCSRQQQQQQQQQKSLKMMDSKAKLPRTPSPLRRKQGLIGTLLLQEATTAAADSAGTAVRGLKEPLLPKVSVVTVRL